MGFTGLVSAPGKPSHWSTLKTVKRFRNATVRASLAATHVTARLLRLLVRQPALRTVSLRDTGGPQDQHIDP